MSIYFCLEHGTKSNLCHKNIIYIIEFIIIQFNVLNKRINYLQFTDFKTLLKPNLI